MHGRAITEQVIDHLSGEDVLALKFAVHRQLARWAKKEKLSPHQRAQREALVRAARVLAANALVHGCRLQALGEE